MENKKQEVSGMTNKQAIALIEAIKIITEQANSPDEIKNALDRIQSALKNPK